MSTPAPTTFFRVLNGKLRYPVPLPPSVACGHQACRGVSGYGPWSDNKRRTKLESHFKDVHKQVFQACYPCPACGSEFSTAQALNGHLRSATACPRVSANPNLSQRTSVCDDRDVTARSTSGRSRPSIGSRVANISTRRSVDPYQLAEISGENVVASYPGRPQRCPWNSIRPNGSVTCDRVISGTGFHVLQGLHRHLFTVHRKDLGKLWKCSKCGQLIDDGNKMRRHFEQCAVGNQSPSTSLSATLSVSQCAPPTRTSTPASDALPAQVTLESPTLGNSPPSRRESHREQAGPMANLSGSPVGASAISLSAVITDSPSQAYTEAPADSPPNPRSLGMVNTLTSCGDSGLFGNVHLVSTGTADQSNRLLDAGVLELDSSSPTTNDDPTEQSFSDEIGQVPGSASLHTEANTFFGLWSQAFSSCQTSADLNDVLGRCSNDWLAKAYRSHPPIEERPPRRDPPRSPKRVQARQLQRLRQKRKSTSDEASRIQKLFKVYPKRAVRQVLGERSLPYTGDVKSAEAYLRETYCRPLPNNAQCMASRELFQSCNWSAPSEDQLTYLNLPPTREEIEGKLSRAKNTAPGNDGIEYRHLRALDPKGHLLEVIYCTVCKIGIPEIWRSARTVPIYKKGNTSDYSNFRPISLLPTMYKIFSGILSQRLTQVAVDLGWLSPEQKGFLPGVHGIQEHTQLLQTAVEGAQNKRLNLSIAWLDLCNAFGSIPHAVLAEMFNSLPIPDDLRRLLLDIYSDNVLNFVVGKESVKILPTAGVRQGDALSTTVFNLAAEPMIRAVKSSSIPGVMLFGQKVKVTAYADDLAVLCATAEALQWTLDALSDVAAVLGLSFNAGKCACLLLRAGQTFPGLLTIGNASIRCLNKEDHEVYLGVPIGTKLTFRAPNDLVFKMDKLADSLLAPWQKLEVYRSHLLPSLSHHLASARVEKEGLTALDFECRKFLGRIVGVPITAAVDFFYADRRVGGLGTFSLSEDADVWTLARAVQLLSSSDPLVREVFKEQLNDTIMRGFNDGTAPATLPVGPYLSGSIEGGLYRLRFARGGKNLWTSSRAAAKRLRARIDVSGDSLIRVIADDISSNSAKVVRGLRQVVRKRHTDRFIQCAHQGLVAKTLALDTATKDIARQTSTRTELGHDDWRYLFRTRLDLLPLRGYVWSSPPNQPCRRCGDSMGKENAFHLLNNCKMNMSQYTKRHNAVLDILADLLTKEGLNPSINRQTEGSGLRPDIELVISGSRALIDVRVSYDTVPNLENARDEKIAKYQHLGTTLPLIVGSLGSWLPSNEDIRAFLGVSGRRWATFRRQARVAAIKGSLDIIRETLKAHGSEIEDADPLPVYF